MESKNVIIQVYGRVQGVGFRYSAQREARALRLCGYALNKEDGSVEIVACGVDENVERLIAWINAGGPPGARVDEVTVKSHLTAASYTGFHIRY